MAPKTSQEWRSRMTRVTVNVQNKSISCTGTCWTLATRWTEYTGRKHGLVEHGARRIGCGRVRSASIERSRKTFSETSFAEIRTRRWDSSWPRPS